MSWRRYLAQQMELGGSGGGARRRGSGASGGSSGGRRSSERRAAACPPLRGTAAQVAPEKGAPPIPGPGLAVTSPEPMLLGNELATLPTLDAVAERIRTTHCCGLCARSHQRGAGRGQSERATRARRRGAGRHRGRDRPAVRGSGRASCSNGILEAIEVPRDSVYITNIVKCRPPQNRKPLPDEIAACIPYLHRQLELIRPKVILALGGTAAEAMLGVRKSLGELRDKVHTYNGIPLIVTYHPAALLRNPNWKKPTWDDVRIARQLLDR